MVIRLQQDAKIAICIWGAYKYYLIWIDVTHIKKLYAREFPEIAARYNEEEVVCDV